MCIYCKMITTVSLLHIHPSPHILTVTSFVFKNQSTERTPGRQALFWVVEVKRGQIKCPEVLEGELGEEIHHRLWGRELLGRMKGPESESEVRAFRRGGLEGVTLEPVPQGGGRWAWGRDLGCCCWTTSIKKDHGGGYTGVPVHRSPVCQRWECFHVTGGEQSPGGRLHLWEKRWNPSWVQVLWVCFAFNSNTLYYVRC